MFKEQCSRIKYQIQKSKHLVMKVNYKLKMKLNEFTSLIIKSFI